MSSLYWFSLSEDNKQLNLQRLILENAQLKLEHKRKISCIPYYAGNSTLTLPECEPHSSLSRKIFKMNRSEVFLGSLLHRSHIGLLKYRILDKYIIVETAVAAMDELAELLHLKEPVWVKSQIDERYSLHCDNYNKLFRKLNYLKTSNARIESSKDSGEMAMAAVQLIEMFLDSNKWKQKQLKYLRLEALVVLYICKRFFAALGAHHFAPRLHSALITWIEHIQVDDELLIHALYRDSIHACQAYGAKRWILSLQRICERLTFPMEATTYPKHEFEGVIDSAEGRRNLMKLSQRMMVSFCEMLSISDKLDFPHLSELNNSGIRVSLRKSSRLGEPDGFIISATSSLRLPISHENLFDFFKDEKKELSGMYWPVEDPLIPLLTSQLG